MEDFEKLSDLKPNKMRYNLVELAGSCVVEVTPGLDG